MKLLSVYILADGGHEVSYRTGRQQGLCLKRVRFSAANEMPGHRSHWPILINLGGRQLARTPLERAGMFAMPAPSEEMPPVNICIPPRSLCSGAYDWGGNHH